MKCFIGRTAAAVLVLGLGWFFTQQAVQGQKVAKTRPASTKVLMQGIIFPNCAAIGGILKEGPADEKAWASIVLKATVLNELGYVVMDDGRCPDKVWAGAAKILREGSAKLIETAQAKDLDASRAAFKTLTSGCATCHGTHKKKKA